MMNDRLSAALGRIAPSATLAMSGRVIDLKSQGIDVIGLSAGEPDFDTPEFVKDAAIQAIRDGMTKYTAVDGIAPLKQAIIAKFKRDNGIEYTPKQITVNSGGKHTLFNALVATIDKGDEVIIPAPYWVSYPDIVQFAGGTPVIVMATAAQNYKITPEQLEAAITPKTRWLILNSPSNPTGAAYDAAELKELGEVLLRHPHVLLLSDDMYEHIWYAQSPFATMLQVCPELYDRTLTMNGASKAYAMTGWRIGYAAGPQVIMDVVKNFQDHSTSNPSSISQAAAIEALNGPQDFIAERIAIFQARRDAVVSKLNAIEGITCHSPEGAFYVFPSCAGVLGKKTPSGQVLKTDEDFVLYLLDSEMLAGVQGAAYGTTPFFRFSFATSMDVLDEACVRLKRAVEKLTA